MEGMLQSGCTGSKRALLTPKVIFKKYAKLLAHNIAWRHYIKINWATK